MERINFVNDQEPNLSAENLNKIQDNIEEAAQTGGILVNTVVAYDGDTIPEGYEEVEDVIDYEIANLPEKSVGINIIEFKKYGKLVILNADIIYGHDFIASTVYSLGNIPKEILPKNDKTTGGVVINGDTHNAIGYAKVGIRASDGYLYCKPNVSFGTSPYVAGISFSMSWFLD